MKNGEEGVEKVSRIFLNGLSKRESKREIERDCVCVCVCVTERVTLHVSDTKCESVCG